MSNVTPSIKAVCPYKITLIIYSSPFVCVYCVCLSFRYSKGFGFLGTLLGEDHPLNIYNSVYGLLYYTVIFVLGTSPGAGEEGLCKPAVYSPQADFYLPLLVGKNTAGL